VSSGGSGYAVICVDSLLASTQIQGYRVPLFGHHEPLYSCEAPRTKIDKLWTKPLYSCEAWQGERERGLQLGELTEERGCGEGANGEQRGRCERVRWFLKPRGGLGLGCIRRKRLGGLGCVLGMALWTQSSDARENTGGFLSRS
jgi:hypothetical protein